MTLEAMLPIVLIGAGGHAKVVLALARALGREVVGVCDPALARDGITCWRDVPVLGSDEALAAWSPDRVELINGIGQLPQGAPWRLRVHEHFTQRGFRFPALVHPAAWVDQTATLAAGVQVMAGAMLQADVTVGEYTVINTGARIDHDCLIGRHVHVAPGATLCGSVTVDAGAFIGAGATVIHGIRIGRNAVVGAGVTLVRDLSPTTTILGAANRLLKQDT